MKAIIDTLTKDIFDGMKEKLSYLHPKKGGYFPPEANLLFEIAKLGAKYHYFSYGEANFGSRTRRDMVLLSPEGKWICQVEAKIVNSGSCRKGAVISDLERVNDPASLKRFIENDDFRKKEEVKSYSRYGLFVGGSVCWFFSWWNSMNDSKMRDTFIQRCITPDLQPEKYIKDLDEQLRNSMIKGTHPDVPEGEDLWLVYALYDLSTE
ncbi:MAG: hypothetical protein ACP5FY_12305 [Kosmotogaceae bacterium]